MIIDNHVLPYVYNVHDGPAKFVLQEDNRGPYRARSIAMYLSYQDVQFADLNSVENLWHF